MILSAVPFIKWHASQRLPGTLPGTRVLGGSRPSCLLFCIWNVHSIPANEQWWHTFDWVGALQSLSVTSVAVDLSDKWKTDRQRNPINTIGVIFGTSIAGLFTVAFPRISGPVDARFRFNGIFSLGVGRVQSLVSIC